MDKAFNLHILWNMGADFPNLLQRELSCRNHPFSSQLVPEQIGAVICIVGLGAYMKLHIRQDSSRDGEDAGIRDNQGIRLNLF